MLQRYTFLPIFQNCIYSEFEITAITPNVIIILVELFFPFAPQVGMLILDTWDN